MSRSRIYSVVALIPRGRVSTYGRVAALAGIPGQARQVGYALAALPDHSDVPWHRVINAKGEISARSNGAAHDQRTLLESEGVAFDAGGKIGRSQRFWPDGGE